MKDNRLLGTSSDQEVQKIESNDTLEQHADDDGICK